MAGSYEHCLTEDRKHYRGLDLLENMKDRAEAIEHMVFMIKRIEQGMGSRT